jgi:hypothetical protein
MRLREKLILGLGLCNIHGKEKISWHQRSHARQLLHGDQNTSYFNKIANGRKEEIMSIT